MTSIGCADTCLSRCVRVNGALYGAFIGESSATGGHDAVAIRRLRSLPPGMVLLATDSMRSNNTTARREHDDDDNACVHIVSSTFGRPHPHYRMRDDFLNTTTAQTHRVRGVVARHHTHSAASRISAL